MTQTRSFGFLKLDLEREDELSCLVSSDGTHTERGTVPIRRSNENQRQGGPGRIMFHEISLSPAKEKSRPRSPAESLVTIR
mmetsp:Transcript_27476/g.44710  ORF Transcript_27476/g.44710 Transcript_27476/m.44710 type:complete len:81 (+) Transcript_27476:768-1010(+)